MRLLFFVLFAFSLLGMTPTSNYSVSVTVTGINKISGKIDMSIFNKADGFLVMGKQLQRLTKEVTANSVTCTFTNIPAGYYAVSLYHDVNSDGKCNLNFVGYPKEGFGFSNDYKPIVSAPSFDEAKFNVAASKSISIKLID